MNSNPNFNKPK